MPLDIIFMALGLGVLFAPIKTLTKYADIFLSLGGFLSGLLDFGIDGKINNSIYVF